MLAVEEIRRISGIKREFFKAGKWPEWRRGPLPSVPEHLDRSVHAGGTQVHRRRIPPSKICVYGSRTLRGPVELRFRRQRSSASFRIRRRLRVRDVHRPVERQWNFAEHAAQKPFALPFDPKIRRCAFAYMLQILTVRDLELRNTKCRNRNRVTVDSLSHPNPSPRGRPSTAVPAGISIVEFTIAGRSEPTGLGPL